MSNHAHNLDPWSICIVSNMLSNGVLTRPITPCQDIVDHSHSWMTAAIAFIEPSPAQQRNLHCRQVAWSGRPQVAMRPRIVGPLWAILDFKTLRRVETIDEGQRKNLADSNHAGLPTQASIYILKKVFHLYGLVKIIAGV